MSVPHKIVIAKGRLVKQRTHGKYTMYSVIIHKRKGIPTDLESLVGKELTVILADEGGEQ
jgi:hypothetical protein